MPVIAAVVIAFLLADGPLNIALHAALLIALARTNAHRHEAK